MSLIGEEKNSSHGDTENAEKRRIELDNSIPKCYNGLTVLHIDLAYLLKVLGKREEKPGFSEKTRFLAPNLLR